jgi:hypothetical protein
MFAEEARRYSSFDGASLQPRQGLRGGSLACFYRRKFLPDLRRGSFQFVASLQIHPKFRLSAKKLG